MFLSFLERFILKCFLSFFTGFSLQWFFLTNNCVLGTLHIYHPRINISFEEKSVFWQPICTCAITVWAR
jgi:hypothetical protein